MIAKTKDYYKTMTPLDMLTGFYCTLMILLILCRVRALGSDIALSYAGYYAISLSFILLLVPILDQSNHKLLTNPITRLVRNMYPLLLFGIFYNWTEPVSHMFYSQPFDTVLIDIELFLFGANAGRDMVHWLGNNYWLSEYMNFSYLSFYLTPWLVMFFYFAKKEREFHYTGFVYVMTIFFCFFLQSIFPAEGPIYNDASIPHHIVAGPISAFAADFLSNADVPGSAMPSGHVALTVSVLLLTWQFFRRAFWVTAPLWISLCIATVYGHFHYVIDGIAGIAIAVFFVYWAGPKIFSRLFPDLVPEIIAERFPLRKKEEESVLTPSIAK